MEVLASMIKKFGLNTSEAKVYVALLVLHDAKASEIAKQARVPRNKLYEIAESLNKKGFVEIIPEKVMKFRAVPFEAVCDMHMKSWQQQMDEIDKTKKDIMQRLKKISEPHDEKSYFAVLRSRKVIRKRLEDIMQSPDRILLMINISDMRYLVNFARKATKNKELNVIVPVNRDSMPLVKKWTRFAKVRHYQTSMQEKIAVTKDAVLIFEFGTPLALYSNDPKFVSMFRSFLEAEWSIATPAEAKIKEIETGKPAEEIVLMRGRENLYRILPDFYDEAEKDAMVITSPNGIVRMHKYLGKHIEDAAARGVRMRVITTINKDNMEIARKLAAEIRHVDKVHAVAGCRDDQMLILIDLKNDSPTKNSPDDVVLVTKNSDTIKVVRQMLESMWEHATPLEERIAEIETGKPREEIIFMRGRENLYNMLPDFYDKAKNDMIIMTSSNGIIRIHRYLNKYLENARSRGVKCRVITTITKNNTEAAKNIAADVRHVDKVHAVFSCYDDLMIIHDTKNDNISKDSPDDVVLITNNSGTVNMMRQMLESVWGNAASLEERVKELETGKPRVETRYIYGRQKLYELVPQLVKDTENDILWTTSEIGLVRIYNNFKDVIEKNKNRIRIRCFAPITSRNIEFAKKLGIEIRHIDKVYAVADCYDDSVAVVINPGTDLSNDEVMITNKQEMVKMMRQMLESMWEHAMPLEDREKELESQYTEKELAESVALEKMYDQTGNVKKT